MTVLAVQKEENYIYVASDSRCSWNGITVDYCTKIFKVDLKIRTSIGFEKNTSVGFAFAGGVDFFFDIKNRLEFVLSNVFVQQSEVELDNIVCELIRNVCQDVADAYKQSFAKTGSNLVGNTDILLFMKSLVNDGTGATDFVYKDFWIDNDYNVRLIDKSGEYQFFGSGEGAARRLKDSGDYEWKNIVRFVKDVIDDMSKAGNVSVGGNVQVGVLERDGFRVLGYRDIDKNGNYVYYYGSAVIPDYECFEPLGASFLVV